MTCRYFVLLLVGALLAGPALAAGPFSIKPVADPSLARDVEAFAEFMRQEGSNTCEITLGQLHYNGRPLREVKYPIQKQAGLALLKSAYEGAAEYLSESDEEVGEETGRQTERWLRSTSEDYTANSEAPDAEETQRKNRATLVRLFKNAATMKGWGLSQTDSGLTVSATLLVDYKTGRTVYVELLQFP